MDLLTTWVLAQNVPGLTLEVLREKGRTPVIFIVVPGTNATSETVRSMRASERARAPGTARVAADLQTGSLACHRSPIALFF